MPDVVSKTVADRLGDAFAAGPVLASAGGAALVERRGRLVAEDVGRGHARGATRAVRARRLRRAVVR
jgi:hypothetical protein